MQSERDSDPALGDRRWALQTIGSALALAACSKRSSREGTAQSGGAPEKLELRCQGFTGQVTFPELAEDLGLLAPIKLDYVGNTSSGPQDIQTVATGDTDFGGAFNGAVIKLIAANAPVKSVIGFYGTDETTWQGYYVLDGSPIKSARDLIGKKRPSSSSPTASTKRSLGQRVAIMTSRPGRIKTIIEVPEALRHSDDVRSHPEFAGVRHEIWSALREEVKRAQEQERRSQLQQPSGTVVSRRGAQAHG